MKHIKQLYSKKLFLINPPIKEFFSKYSNDDAFPPLGIISIGTSIKKNYPEWNVTVFDGQVTPTTEILKSIEQEKPDIVGLSVLAETYETSLKFAKHTKKYGGTTIFGNDQASLLGENILKNKSDVDYICTGEHGEICMNEFIDFFNKNRDITNVSDLLYRDNNNIIRTKTSKLPDIKYKMDVFDIPDRTLLSHDVWNVYKKNYYSQYGNLYNNVHGVTTINRGRGCPRSCNRCVYCGIMDLSIKLSSPEMFWNDIRHARETIGANIFYEVFDSMSSVPWWVKSLVENKPKDLDDIKFIVYAQAKDINPKIVDLYKKLGVIMVNMGLDSGDNTTLKRLKSIHDDVKYNKKAVELINQSGMHVFASFVLGSPGENINTLENTYNFTKWLVDNNYACSIEAQPLMPRAKSKVGKWFESIELAKNDMHDFGLKLKNETKLIEVIDYWKNSDSTDTPYVSSIYADVFTDVNYEILVSYSNKIVKYAKDAGLGSGSVGIRTE